jgi:hypothetical protein
MKFSGEVLETLNTNQVNNSFACISPCGRFVASAGEFGQMFILFSPPGMKEYSQYFRGVTVSV